MSRAELGRDLEVAAHSHTEAGKTVAFRDLGEQLKMQGRFLIDRRNAHQTQKRQLEVVPALRDEGIGIVGQNPRFLVLGAGVDLNETPRPLAHIVHGAGQRTGRAQERRRE